MHVASFHLQQLFLSSVYLQRKTIRKNPLTGLIVFCGWTGKRINKQSRFTALIDTKP